MDAVDREVILWMLPRGLITIVLALQVVEARGVGQQFLPALAFGIILATNLIMILSSVRTTPAATVEEAEILRTPCFASMGGSATLAPVMPPIATIDWTFDGLHVKFNSRAQFCRQSNQKALNFSCSCKFSTWPSREKVSNPGLV